MFAHQRFSAHDVWVIGTVQTHVRALICCLLPYACSYQINNQYIYPSFQGAQSIHWSKQKIHLTGTLQMNLY